MEKHLMDRALELKKLTEDERFIAKVVSSFPQIKTPRELQVLYYLLNFFDNKEIADKLFIAKRTVKSHNTNIFKKTGVLNRRLLLASFYQSPAEKEIRASVVKSGVSLPYSRTVNE